MFRSALLMAIGLACAAALPAHAETSAYDSLIATHAAANGVPESLVRRVIMRESRYNPRIVSRGNYGLMQIKPATARSLGYTGTPDGLLDPDTNLRYAVKYLAGAYRAAHGDEKRAIAYYAGGYYGRGESRTARGAHESRAAPARGTGWTGTPRLPPTFSKTIASWFSGKDGARYNSRHRLVSR